ncbi:hypothetical protein JW758_00760 [Candidatus Peregrinibacteria bacterium]|nr:hypothetical protein [Candidatus Peregrinibacteria bacterium]
MKITISEKDLNESGFTQSGICRFKEVASGYVNSLFEKAIYYGKANKGDGLEVEITHDNVRSAAHNIANSYGKPTKSTWSIVGNVAEYIFTIIATWGLTVPVAQNVENTTTIGVITEHANTIGTVCIALTVLLIVIRLTRN